MEKFKTDLELEKEIKKYAAAQVTLLHFNVTLSCLYSLNFTLLSLFIFTLLYFILFIFTLLC
jgi:hypothetical protein